MPCLSPRSACEEECADSIAPVKASVVSPLPDIYVKSPAHHHLLFLEVTKFAECVSSVGITCKKSAVLILPTCCLQLKRRAIDLSKQGVSRGSREAIFAQENLLGSLASLGTE